MRRLGNWTFRILCAVLFVLVLLLAPIAYVEIGCRGSAKESTYQAVLTDEHHRPVTRTLMTYPEWHIVHAYDDYARVIAKDAPHDFAFLRSIKGFWSSLCTLSEKSAELGKIDLETKQMVYVIGVSFTAELGLKALYEETIGRLFIKLRGEARAPLDDLSAQHAGNYAKFLQQVPWYKWRFAEDATELKATASSALRDKERRFALGLEYGAKASYAKVIAQAVESAGQDALTLQMVVKGITPETLDQFKGVTIIETVPEGIVIETLRYRALTHLMKEMVEKGAEFVEIAGNNQIMFTAISTEQNHADAIASMDRQGGDDYRHLFLTNVSLLASKLKSHEAADIQLEHIHDY